MLKRLLRRVPFVDRYVAPSVLARRILKRYRPPHFHPLRGWMVGRPAPLGDRAGADIDAINRRSEAYFEKSEHRSYWLNRPYSDPSAAHVLSRFAVLLSYLRPRAGDRVLDFGCGTGWTSVMMARMGAEVVGMDIAPAALRLAEEVADREMGDGRGRLRFAPYGGDGIASPDGDFDFVVVNDAFHHFPNPARLLGEFHRVLAPHGMFGFSEPGIGHSGTAHSQAERELGVLEEDVDLEQLHWSGRAAGFSGLDVLIPPLDPDASVMSMDGARAFLRGVPGVLPTDLLRVAVLTGPIGVLRKGPYRATSLHPRTHQARVTPRQQALRVAPGAAFALPVEVWNPTETVWLVEGRRGMGYVRLGAHLHDGDGGQIDRDYGRASLPRDLRQREGAIVTLSLTAPAAPGRYIVRLDMVNEGLRWFAQEGSPTAEVVLTVAG